MIGIDSRRLGLGVAALLLVSGCASFASNVGDSDLPIGAWASGTSAEACETSPITYF